MSKAGRIMLFVLAIFAIAGATNTTNARTVANQANTCSSSLVSTASCVNNTVKLCTKPTPEVKKEVGSAVIVATPKENQAQVTAQTAPVTEAPTPQVTMPALNTQMVGDGAVLDSEKIFSLVNQYRASRGLAAFEKDDKVCELAQTRSAEVVSEIAGSGPLHSGLYNRNLPYWIWENAKYGSNEEGTVAWWLGSPVHHQSIVGDFKYSCVKCTGSYCAQLFTSYVPK